VASQKVPSSSKVAAGLFNPLVFKRLTQSWKAEELIPFLKERYSQLEKLLGVSFLHFVPISKILPTPNELDLWRKKREKENLKAFIGQDYSIQINGIKEELILGDVVSSGYVDLKSFLSAATEYFHHFLIDEVFSFADFIPSEKPVYKGVYYDGVIFCEGFHVQQNPYFSFIPFKPVNGDVLSVIIPSYDYSKTLNKNFFLLPFGDGTYRLGATYNWDNLVFEPSETAKADLLKRVKEFVEGDVKVLQHEAGVRPSCADRRPVLGPHPVYKNLFIFNGLGTKGVMLAPYFAKQMGEFLVNEKPLEHEVSVQRFYNL